MEKLLKFIEGFPSINTYKKESKQRGELIAIRKLRTRLDEVKEKDRRPNILLLDDNEDVKIETIEDCKSIKGEIIHAQSYTEKDGETYINVKTASRVMFLLIMIAEKAKIEISLMRNDLNKLAKEKTSQRLTSLNLNFEQLEDKVAKQQEKIAEQEEEMCDTKQLLGKIYAMLKGSKTMNKRRKR